MYYESFVEFATATKNIVERKVEFRLHKSVAESSDTIKRINTGLLSATV